jgi:succinoglycan biosynthesis protein ExoA
LLHWNTAVDVERASESLAARDKVLIVIPCLNEQVHVARLILEMSDAPPWLDQLIVVADGGSTDATREIVARIAERNSRVRLISNPGRIQSAGVNLAARMFGSGRRWLVRVDAHSAYPRGYVSTLVREALRTGAASVVVSMLSRGKDGFQCAAAAAQNSILGSGGSAHRRQGKAEFVDHGHHALFDLELFLKVGGYDEALSHNEDAEFDVRLARAGGKIWLTRETQIVYFPRSKPKDLFRQYMDYGRGRATTMLRHKMRPKVRQILPACVAPALLAIPLSPWVHAAGAPALVWGGLCLAFGAAIGRRDGGKGAVKTGLAAMVMHLGWSVGFWRELIAECRTKRRTSEKPWRAGSLTHEH